MTGALFSQNPFVATLIGAMQSGSSWLDAPVVGVIHDSHYETSTGILSNTAAVQFTGVAVPSSSGGTQIDIEVLGDASQLPWLTQYCSTLPVSAVAPASIHGTVTNGGLHGSLVVLAPGGQFQIIQW